MLYLFGRLALSDSLDYYENFQDDDFRPAASHGRPGEPQPETRSPGPAANRQLHRSQPSLQAEPAGTCGLGN